MRLLLDTHALLWWLDDDPRLGTAARDLVADRGNDVLVSVVSLWEIVVKVRVGKLDADIGEIKDALDREGLDRIGIGPAHLATLGGLPRFADHRDPFDHLLIAQAISERAVLLSDDRRVGRYPVERRFCSETAPPS